MGKMISFVIPCYRSQATLPSVIREIQETMEGLRQYTYEVVLVNDCSPDNTFDSIRELCRENKNITANPPQALSLRRIH